MFVEVLNSIEAYSLICEDSSCMKLMLVICLRAAVLTSISQKLFLREMLKEIRNKNMTA